MPIQIIDVDDGIGAVIMGHGLVSDDVYLRAMTAHLSQPPERFRRYRYTLADYTGITGLDVSVGMLNEVGRQLLEAARVNPDIVLAIVALSDEVFGLARMSQMAQELPGWDQMVFRARPDAERWLAQRVGARFGITRIPMRPVTPEPG